MRQVKLRDLQRANADTIRSWGNFEILVDSQVIATVISGKADDSQAPPPPPAWTNPGTTIHEGGFHPVPKESQLK
jgi:hypothetical protein